MTIAFIKEHIFILHETTSQFSSLGKYLSSLFFLLLFFFFFLLRWVFVTAHRLSLSAAGGGTSLVAMCGFLLAIAPPIVKLRL